MKEEFTMEKFNLSGFDDYILNHVKVVESSEEELESNSEEKVRQRKGTTQKGVYSGKVRFVYFGALGVHRGKLHGSVISLRFSINMT
ncbi:hypothetical protein ACH5RR_021372 [Cinchona calisaya]|uniref:Uncharacterized protein n=1 Tax=Cinchona calisaya TaxID=153742 RepID=A0ABD2ZIC1_9GENT